jgi:hypothetical protein
MAEPDPPPIDPLRRLGPWLVFALALAALAGAPALPAAPCPGPPLSPHAPLAGWLHHLASRPAGAFSAASAWLPPLAGAWALQSLWRALRTLSHPAAGWLAVAAVLGTPGFHQQAAALEGGLLPMAFALAILASAARQGRPLRTGVWMGLLLAGALHADPTLPFLPVGAIALGDLLRGRPANWALRWAMVPATAALALAPWQIALWMQEGHAAVLALWQHAVHGPPATAGEGAVCGLPGGMRPPFPLALLREEGALSLAWWTAPLAALAGLWRQRPGRQHGLWMLFMVHLCMLSAVLLAGPTAGSATLLALPLGHGLFAAGLLALTGGWILTAAVLAALWIAAPGMVTQLPPGSPAQAPVPEGDADPALADDAGHAPPHPTP